jgi:cell wall integrity and stress response component
VVVGLAAISAIAGALFLFIRNRRRRAVEEEYRRNAAVSSFISSTGKPPGSSSEGSFTDTRLDPLVMAHRRMSDGSIADNQDYSRRILKVCGS